MISQCQASDNGWLIQTHHIFEIDKDAPAIRRGSFSESEAVCRHWETSSDIQRTNLANQDVQYVQQRFVNKADPMDLIDVVVCRYGTSGDNIKQGCITKTACRSAIYHTIGIFQELILANTRETTQIQLTRITNWVHANVFL